MNHKNFIKQFGIGVLTVNLSFGMALHPKASETSNVFTGPPGQQVHYNWGSGGPPGMPTDHFTANFDQSGQYSGDYFVQTLADDGVQVEADGQMLINRWSSSAGTVDQALWTNVQAGQHTVKTHYYEDAGNAAVFSDIVPFDSWLAYYYPNNSLSGLPTAAKVIQPSGDLKKLYEDNGTGSPATGVPADYFSARYVTAKHITAGDYIVHAKADDGVRVYVDGKLVLDRWTPGNFQEDMTKIHIADRTDATAGQQDVHWIQVEYNELGGGSKIETYLEPFQSAIDNSWVGEYFPNMNLSGNPIVAGGANAVAKLSDVNFNWQGGSPSPSIPTDHFSARFTKKVTLAAGTYQFNVAADDGVRVLVDNQPVIDSWKDSAGDPKTGKTTLTAGTHTITVEYYENAGGASLSFNYFPIIQAPTQVGGTVHYNWGSGSPQGMPADHFTADFDQSGQYSGDYFVQTLADDGVQVEADGQKLIDRWSPSAGAIDRALWMGVTGGQHSVITHYYEDIGNAAVFSDIVPFDSWLAYYYPNDSLTGLPTAAKVLQPSGDLKKLYEDNGTGSPATGIPADHFSAKYVTAKHIAAGDYIVHAKADDGVRVYVDGNLVLDRWTPGAFEEDMTKVHIANRTDAPAGQQDVHWVQVEYNELGGGSRIEAYLEPFQAAADNSWVGEYYPNMSLSGSPDVVGGANASAKLSDVNFNWQGGSPNPSIPADHFSARFTKVVSLDQGVYQFNVKADDGVRVLVDNQPVINSWSDSAGDLKTGTMALSKGSHTITVEYYENAGDASLSFSYSAFAKMPTQVGGTVHYNWGTGSPTAGIPADHFTANFDQSGRYAAGDYFVQTLADDGVKVTADGQALINRWGASAGETNQALWMGVTGGQHTVNTDYFEDSGNAAVFSDIVPFDSWLAYYYPNDSLTGLPTAAKVIQPSGDLKKLYEDNGTGSPATGIPSDHFSARYVTAKHLSAGDYIVHAKADDGVRVYVDGKLVMDRWTPGTFQENETKIHIDDNTGAPAGQQDVHWVQVEYNELAGGSKLDVSLEPFQTAIDNSWVGELFANPSMSGNPIVIGGSNSTSSISDLKFDWKAGSPDASIPADYFSARFTKKVTLDAGTYVFNAKADDGLRVYLDNQLILDSWQNSDVTAAKKVSAYVTSGQHTIVAEYREDVGNASLSLDYQQISQNKVFYSHANQIHYNWGTGSPDGFPADNFDAVFDQTQTINSGDYFMQAAADDSVKVAVDGQTKIDSSNDAAGTIEKALMLNMSAGEHQIITNYHENDGSAFINSDIVPFDSWLAYYYPNTALSGNPVAVKTIAPTGTYKELSEQNGNGSPAAGVPADNFSARYTTAKRMNAGDYVLRTKADDGIRVYVDGNLVLDHWTANNGTEDAVKVSIQDRNVQNPDEKNVHWIEVQYYEGIGQSGVDVFFQSLTDVTNTDQWVGYLYPSKDLTGNPMILGGVGAQTPLTNLNFDWGTGQPQALIPADGFSARFTKSAYFNTGIYQINTHSDDGIRVYVDGDLKIDAWADAVSDHSASLVLGAGYHNITVEYYENTLGAALKVDVVNTTSQNAKLVSSFDLPVYRSYSELSDYRLHLTYYNPSYTRYAELGYGDLVYLISTSSYGAQIMLQDGRIGWVQKDYLVDNLANDCWLVKDTRTIRSQPSTTSTSLGTVASNSKVLVLDHKTTSDSYSDWYYIQTDSGLKGWIWGATLSSYSPDRGYDLVKYEFNKSGTVTNQIDIFTPLNTQANVTADQINSFIDYKTAGRKSVMTGMGWAYLQAQQLTGVNAIYLLAHSGHETAWGTSNISSTKFNFYGIGALDVDPLGGAYDFSTPAGGIIQGAIWISNNYINNQSNDQSTLDSMRWNQNTHQYASDEAWAVKIESYTQEFYNFINK